MTKDKNKSELDEDVKQNQRSKNESKIKDVESSSKTSDETNPRAKPGTISRAIPETKMGKLKTNIKDTIEYKSRPLEWYYYVGFAVLIAIWFYAKSIEDQAAADNNPALNGATKSEVCLEFVKNQSPMNGDFNRATIDGDIITVHQVRGGEGKIFFYDCKINNNGIVWRINKEDGGMGPWRGTLESPAATFDVFDGEISIN